MSGKGGYFVVYICMHAGLHRWRWFCIDGGLGGMNPRAFGG
jgi:hypothetical protein